MAPRTHSSADGAGSLNIAQRAAQLSPRRRQIVRPLLADPRQFVLLSVRDVAKRLGTDASTMVRIVRDLQFDSYRAFQHHLHELSLASATSLETMQASAVRQHGIAAQIRRSLQEDKHNLEALQRNFDVERVTRVARKIHTARRILVLGGDLAIALVFFLEYHLTLLALPVFSGTIPGRSFNLTRAANHQDVVIAMSFRRGLRMTVEGLETAHSKGAFCVGIADTLLSPLLQFSHESFLASVESSSFGASYVAPMALMNALVSACANVDRNHTLSLLKEVDEEQRHGSRWYTPGRDA